MQQTIFVTVKKFILQCTPTSQVSPPTVSSQHEQSVPLQTIIIGVVGSAVVLAFLVFVVLLAVCIIQRQRHHDKDKVDGNGMLHFHKYVFHNFIILL